MTNERDLWEHRFPAFFTATILDWKKLSKCGTVKNYASAPLAKVLKN